MQSDKTAKQKGKECAETQQKAKQKFIQVEDYVLVQQKHQNKFSTSFQRELMKAIKVYGPKIVYENKNGQIHRRNSASIKAMVI